MAIRSPFPVVEALPGGSVISSSSRRIWRSDEFAWQADVLSTVNAPELRLSFPQRTVDGLLVVDGWTAWSYLPGEHLDRRWLDVIDVGDRFHRAVAGLLRPSFIEARDRSMGDR